MNRKCGGIHNGKAMSFNSLEEIDETYDFKFCSRIILIKIENERIDFLDTRDIFEKGYVNVVIPVI